MAFKNISRIIRDVQESFNWHSSDEDLRCLRAYKKKQVAYFPKNNEEIVGGDLIPFCNVLKTGLLMILNEKRGEREKTRKRKKKFGSEIFVHEFQITLLLVFINLYLYAEENFDL